VRLNRRACQKFERLVGEQQDRDLGPREQRFVDRHRDACEACQETEFSSSLALNMLREASLEPEIDAGFDERVLRRVRVDRVRTGIGYWSPAFVGAAIACVAIFVALHLAAAPVQGVNRDVAGTEARRDTVTRPVPSLELDHVPQFVR